MWQPREEYWNYLQNLLEASVGVNSTHQSVDHSSISKAIEEFAKLPDSAFYFAFIFVSNTSGFSDPARGLAGLLLKNKFRASIDCLNSEQVDELLEIIKTPLLQLLLQDNSSKSITFIQRTVGTILSILVTDCGILAGSWPNLLQNLLEIRSLAAYSAIERICEDAAFELIDHKEAFESFLQSVMSLLNTTDSTAEVKVSLLLIIEHLIPTQAALLTSNIDFLIQHAISSANPVNSCRLLSTLLEFYWPLLSPENTTTIFTFVYNLTLQQQDRDLLKQCSEFWLLQIQGDCATDQIRQCPQIFEKLVPLLMDRCAYDDEEDEDELCQALEDLSVPDEEYDLKPIHRREKTETSALDSENDCEESDDPNDALVSSVRKCSAATLDGLSLATPTPKTLLQTFIPAFNVRVASSNWKIREAALLALGAVIEGLWREFDAGSVQQIAGFLLANAQTHPHPLVRSMAIWTLSRLVPFAAPDLDCLGTLIGSLSDRNKRVQQSAATALCKLFESTQKVPTPEHFDSLTSAIFLALKCYQRRSLLVLYDLIRVLAQCDGFAFVDDAAFCYWKSIAATLVGKIGPESLADSSIFPVIEALMALLLCDTQGTLLDAPVRDDMNFKALSLAAQNLTALKEEQAAQAIDAQEIVSQGLDDFLIAALDLLAAGTETSRIFPSAPLQSLLRNILAESLLFTESSNVRQSAFALFGDYASLNRHDFFNEQLQSAYFTALPVNLLPSTLQSSHSANSAQSIVTSMATASNAVWSLGEFALNYKSIPAEITSSLLSILKDRPTLEAGARIYFENVAVCLGRIAISMMEPIISNNTFMNRVFNLLGTVESDSERASALAGYLKLFSDESAISLLVSKINELVDFTDLSAVHPALIQEILNSKHRFSIVNMNHLQPSLRQLLLSS